MNDPDFWETQPETCDAIYSAIFQSKQQAKPKADAAAAAEKAMEERAKNSEDVKMGGVIDLVSGDIRWQQNIVEETCLRRVVTGEKVIGRINEETSERELKIVKKTSKSSAEKKALLLERKSKTTLM